MTDFFSEKLLSYLRTRKTMKLIRITIHTENRGWEGGLGHSRPLMVCFERQGIDPTSNNAYKLLINFAENYHSAED